MDCRGADRVLQMLLVGIPVGEDELREAQLHLESCPICAARYEGEPPGAFVNSEEPPPGMPGLADAPAVLVERALIVALSDDETIVRARAAEELADVSVPGFAAIKALRAAARQDLDEGVRRIAEATLGRLLERGASLTPGPAAAQGEPVLNLGGDDISGQVSAEGGELRLKLNTLPPEFEQTKPLVFLPGAFENDVPVIDWCGEENGLVRADEAVAGGEVEIHLGSLREYKAQRLDAPARPPEALFKLVHLLPLRNL